MRVVGLNRTKNDIVAEQVKGVLKAKTLYEVSQPLHGLVIAKKIL